MSDIPLKSPGVPNLDAAIIATCEEEEMIRGNCNVVHRPCVFCKGSDQNAFRLPGSVRRLARTLVDGLSSTGRCNHRPKLSDVVRIVVNVHRI